VNADEQSPFERTQIEEQRRQLEADAAAWSSRADRDAGLLDKLQLSDLASWLTADTRRNITISDAAESFITASRAAARRAPWQWKTSATSALAILLILGLLATPIVLLLIVVLTASVIHKFG
jgi:hypothetical protein